MGLNFEMWEQRLNNTKYSAILKYSQICTYVCVTYFSKQKLSGKVRLFAWTVHRHQVQGNCQSDVCSL